MSPPSNTCQGSRLSTTFHGQRRGYGHTDRNPSWWTARGKPGGSGVKRAREGNLWAGPGNAEPCSKEFRLSLLKSSVARAVFSERTPTAMWEPHWAGEGLQQTTGTEESGLAASVTGGSATPAVKHTLRACRRDEKGELGFQQEFEGHVSFRRRSQKAVRQMAIASKL